MADSSIPLFEAHADSHQPLARRMRPRNLDEFAGQRHVLAPGKPLDRIIRSRQLASLVIFGPPGTGKTALAHILAEIMNADVEVMNAVTSGVAEIRKVSERAGDRLKLRGTRTLLFIDEIHRFNRSQQDALLPDVEDGRLILLGATTHNPSMYVTSALASRSSFIEFRALEISEIVFLLRNALSDVERGLGSRRLGASDDALRALAAFSDGDARRALNALERVAAGVPDGGTIDACSIEDALGHKAVVYDRAGDAHYDCASALIKSMRGSDPDAAVYYLARMLEGGEDPRFIARRMAIFASEDVGNADARALLVASATIQAVEFVGMPEARIILSQCATYLAGAPKSNSAYEAIDAALEDVRGGALLDVPMSLRGSGYAGARERGRGEGYEYPHSHGGFVRQEYLTENRNYYRPSERGEEKRILERLKLLWGKWPRSEAEDRK